MLSTVAHFVATALGEILDGYISSLWLRQNGHPWLLLPAALA